MPVVVEGVVGLRKALNKLAPDIKKQLDKEMRAALAPIIADAKSHVPGSAPGGLYNYNYPGYERKPLTSKTGRERAFPSYDAAVIRKGLVYSIAPGRMRNSGFVSLFSLLNRSWSGAIVETAGRKNPNGDPRGSSNNPNAGARFIAGMQDVGQLVDYAGRGRESTGRLLYAAYARNQGRALNAIMASIERAKMNLVTQIQTSKKMVA